MMREESVGILRIWRWFGYAESVDGADCNKVKCLRSVGGRRSIFCVNDQPGDSAENGHNSPQLFGSRANCQGILARKNPSLRRSSPWSFDIVRCQLKGYVRIISTGRSLSMCPYGARIYSIGESSSDYEHDEATLRMRLRRHGIVRSEEYLIREGRCARLHRM